jgi:hypothetical protein
MKYNHITSDCDTDTASSSTNTTNSIYYDEIIKRHDSLLSSSDDNSSITTFINTSSNENKIISTTYGSINHVEVISHGRFCQFGECDDGYWYHWTTSCTSFVWLLVGTLFFCHDCLYHLHDHAYYNFMWIKDWNVQSGITLPRINWKNWIPYH